MPAAVVSFIGSNLVAIGSALGAGAASAGVAMAVGAAAVVAGAVAAQKLISELYSVPNIDSDRSRQATVRGTVEPQKLIYGEALVSGPISFVGVSGTDNRDLYHSIVLAGHPSDSISDIYFDDERIQSAHINASGNVTTGTFGPKDGTTICVIRKLTGSQTTADSVLDGAFSTINSSEHIGTNLTYIVTKFTLTDKSQETWDKFLPNDIKALVKGKKVYDPRQDSTSTYYDANVGVGTQRASDSTTWAWSENPVWCLVDYLTDDRFGMGIDLDRIDLSKAVDAADICDATVSVPGGSEKRYTCNGVVFGTSTHKTNINKLLSSMNGMLTYTNGKYVIRAGAFEAVGTGMTLTEDHMTGPVRLKTSFERNERFNTITGTFIDPSKNYKEIEFPKVQITSALTRDNNEELTRELKLSMTNSRFMAQRIAHKLIQLSDLQKVLTFPTNLAGVNISVGDRVNVTLSEFGYTNKTFVCLGWTLSESGTGGVNLTLREDDSSSYADLGSSGYSIVTPAGGIQQGFFGVPDPSGLSATAHVESIELDWTNPANMTGIIAIEVFASPNSSWSSAVKIGETIGTQFIHDESNGVDSIVEGDQRYYWVRARRFPSGEGSDAVSDRNPDSDTSTVQATKGALGNLASQDTVGDGQIDDNAVGQDQIEDGAVGTDQIEDDAVTVDKIANTLQSTNYSEGSAGWRLTVDGDFEAADGDFRGAVKATTLDVEDATIHGTLTATNINAGIVTAETLAADVFAEFDNRYGSSGGFYQEDNDEFFDGSATKYVTLPTVTHDNSKNIYFQCNLVHSWGGTTNYTGDQLKLRVTFEYSTDNSTWATVPNSGENSQIYYERTTSKVIYFVTSAYDLAVDIRYTMSGSSLSDNTAYYFRAKIEYVSSTNVFQLAAAGSANGVPIKFNVQQSAGVTASGGDADSVDGLQASQFVRSDADDTMTGDLTLVGALKMGDTRRIELGNDTDLKISHSGGGGTVENDTGHLTIKNRAVDGDIYFQSDDGTGTGTDTYFYLDGGEKKVKFNEEVVISDDLTVTGNLTITGNIDQYNVTDLDVTDKTITVNSGSTQALSDGAGLIVDRGTATDASITWDETGDQFEFNNAVQIDSGNDQILTLNQATTGWNYIGFEADGTRKFYLGNNASDGFVVGSDVTNKTFTLDNFGSLNIGSANINSSGTVTWSGGSSTNANTAYTYSQVGHLPLAGGTLTGRVTFPTGSTTKPILAEGFFARTTADTTGTHDIWGISATYNPSASSAADQWGIQWSGSPNEINFIGAGQKKLSIDLDTAGDVEIDGNRIWDAGDFSSTNITNWNTAYTYSQVGHLPLSGGTITGGSVDIATAGQTLTVRSGNVSSGTTNKQIIFGYASTTQYAQNIRTRHNSGVGSGNAIDFYLWDQANDASTDHGSMRALKIETGKGVDLVMPSGAYQLGGSTVIASTRRFYASNGTTVKAAYSFDGDSGTGISRTAAGQIDFLSSGAVKAYIRTGTTNPISDTMYVDGQLGVNGKVVWSGGSSTNANTAYSWGDHSAAGYLTGGTNFANDRLITASGANSLNGEANLTFNGTSLSMAGQLLSTYIGGNGGTGSSHYGIHTESTSAGQATMGAHNTGDGYANLNLSSVDNSDRKLWHISKRPSSNNHRLELFWYESGGFNSRYIFATNGDFTAHNNITANGSFVTATSSTAQGIYAGSTQVFEGSTRNFKNLGTINSGVVTASGLISSNTSTTPDKIGDIKIIRLHGSTGVISTTNNLDTFILSKTDGGWGGGTQPSGSDNAQGIISLQTHSGNYYSQLNLVTNGNNLFIRSAYNSTSYSNWEKLLKENADISVGAIDGTKISVDAGGSLGLRLHSNSGITASNNYMNFFTSQTSGWSFNANSSGADTDSVFSISATGTLTSDAITSSGTSSFGNFRLTDTSKMGFGTVKAGASVNHTASVDEGIFWHTSKDYAIYRTLGTWASPDYQQLRIEWATGIEIDGGSAYGKSGVTVTESDFLISNNASDPTLKFVTTSQTADPVLQMNGQAGIASEGFEIWYDNTVGDVHLHTTFDNAAAAIRFHTRTAASKGTSNERFTITGDGHVLLSGDNGFSPYMSRTNTNTLNAGYNWDTDSADLWINYRGYQDGTSRFRDFRVGNGKNVGLIFVDGSAREVDFQNSTDILVGGQLLIDSSRNLTNIGTISSGAITSTGSNNVYAATFTGATGPSVTSLGLNVKTLDGANDVALLVEKTDGTDLFKITGQGVGSFSQRISVQNQDITGTRIQNWQTAYTYSTVGHLPLAGGTMTARINFFTTNVQAPSSTDATTGARLNLYPNGSARDYTIGIEPSNMWFNTDGGFKWYEDGAARMQMETGGHLNLSTGSLKLNGTTRIQNNGNAVFGTISSGGISTNSNFTMTGGFSIYLGTTSRFSSDNNGSFGINYGTTGGSSTNSLVIYNNTTPAVTLFRDGIVQATAGRGFINYTTDARMHLGNNGGGAAGIFAGRRLGDGTSLKYGTYWAYDAFWDDDTRKWSSVRTTLGQKRQIEMNYHTGGWFFKYIDPTTTQHTNGWADSDWTTAVYISNNGLIDANDTIDARLGFLVNGNTVIDANRNLVGIGTINTTGKATIDNAVVADTLHVRGDAESGYAGGSMVGGISLWGSIGQTTSQIMFKPTSAGSPALGNHGFCTDSYNTYFVMDTTNRGWVFRNATTNTNVASISNTGGATFDGGIKVGATTIVDSSRHATFAKVFSDNISSTADRIGAIKIARIHPTSGTAPVTSIDNLETFILSKTDGGYGAGTKPTGGDNATGIISLQTHDGSYYTQLALQTNGNNLWIRSAHSATSYGSWEKLVKENANTTLGTVTTGALTATNITATSLSLSGAFTPTSIAATSTVSGSQFRASYGSESAPAFTFKNDDDTGMYGSANRIHFAVSGDEKIQVQPSSIILYESTTIQNELKVGTIPQTIITTGRALQNVTVSISEAEYGQSLNGNFGQWLAHSRYAASPGFNSDVDYWGWNFVQGNINAPHTGSSQWYRNRVSLGNQYGHGISSGDYWLEMAYPRTTGVSGRMYIRACESGSIGSWVEVGSAIRGNSSVEGNAGIGTSPESGFGRLHIKDSDSGATPYQSGNGGITVERNGRTAINLLSPNTSSGYLFFGDPQSQVAGYIGYDHAATQIEIKSEGYVKTYGSGLDVTGGNVLIAGQEVISGARNITAVAGGFSGLLSNSAGAKLEIQNGTDGGNSRGIFMWTTTDTNWGIYMSTAGSGKSLAGGSASSGLDGRTSHAIRFRVASSSTQIGFLFENGLEQALAQITADSGNFLAKGNITAYASDERLKTNIKPIERPLEKLMKLRGVEFDWIDGIEETHGFIPKCKHETGVIAQEVEQVIPDAISPAPFNNEYKTVEHTKIISLLIESVRSQQETIESLTKRIEELENGDN